MLAQRSSAPRHFRRQSRWALALVSLLPLAALPACAGPRDHAAGHGQNADRSAHMERHAAHMDEHMERLRKDLALTEAQQPLWDRFMEATKSDRAGMMAKGPSRMESNAMPAPERLQQMQSFMIERANSMKQVAEAIKPLYDSLSPEQKAKLDRFFGHGSGHHRRWG